MLKDAADGKFDILVPFDASRLARDGVDIVSTAKVLKSEFGIYVVDSKGQFDNRDHRKTLLNFVHAGLSEDERLRIMERTLGGRIKKAQEGKPWCNHPPIGRAYDKEKEHWYVTDKGRDIKEVLRRYVDGESLISLCREFGIARTSKISAWVWHGQLSGVYKARFRESEIMDAIEVDIPGMPEVIPKGLLAKVQKRLHHNRRFNRHDAKKYNLSGFIRCRDCGRALTGQTRSGWVYYQHKASGCSFRSVRGDEVEPAVLDYLYHTFLDEPAFNAAVQQAMPSPKDRKRVEKERVETERRLNRNEQTIHRLVDAIAKGADVGLLISKQDQLKAEKEALSKRLEELETQIATMPSVEETQTAAMLTRIWLMEEHKGKDWRQLPYEEVKRFLFHLFGECRWGSNTGIVVRKDEKGTLVATFKGNVDFHHLIGNGRPISKAFEKEAARLNAEIKREYEKAIQAADEEYKRAMGELRPSSDNLLHYLSLT
jgi:DNA invertase Pin-like site-specific DNA recombinase